MKKYFLLLVTLVFMATVFTSCEQSNTPTKPNESYYNIAANK